MRKRRRSITEGSGYLPTGNGIGTISDGNLQRVSESAPPPFSRIDRRQPALVVEDLTVRYGSLLAVDGVSFTAHAGKVTAVLGPNGAGKTTTIEICEGLRRSYQGSVRVLGLDPIRDHRALVRLMGVMLQEGGIYPSARPIDSLRQYCGLYAVKGTSPADPEHLLDLVGLRARATTPWRRLSGGEKQRLSLGLALAAQPRIIFLDEPTSGVDVNGRAVIRQIVRRLADDGVAVIMATHELDEAEKVADSVVIIDQGKVLVHGTLDSVRRARRAVRLRTVKPLITKDLPAEIGDWLIEEAPGHYTIDDAPPGLVAALAVWLSEHGIDVIELRTGMTSLEDVFTKLTGDRTTGSEQ